MGSNRANSVKFSSTRIEERTDKEFELHDQVMQPVSWPDMSRTFSERPDGSLHRLQKRQAADLERLGYALPCAQPLLQLGARSFLGSGQLAFARLSADDLVPKYFWKKTKSVFAGGIAA